MNNEINASTQLLNIQQVEKKTSFSKATIYSWVKTGYFPASTLFGEGKRKIARWPESEIDNWISQHYPKSKPLN